MFLFVYYFLWLRYISFLWLIIFTSHCNDFVVCSIFCYHWVALTRALLPLEEAAGVAPGCRTQSSLWYDEAAYFSLERIKPHRSTWSRAWRLPHITPFISVYVSLLYTYAVICPNNIVSVMCNNSYFGWRRIDQFLLFIIIHGQLGQILKLYLFDWVFRFCPTLALLLTV